MKSLNYLEDILKINRNEIISIFQDIVNQFMSKAKVLHYSLLTNGRINSIYRVFLSNAIVSSVIIRIRFMNDIRFIQGFSCESWIERRLDSGKDNFMPKLYWSDDSREKYNFDYMVCEDIAGQTFDENTNEESFFEAGRILGSLHTIHMDFIGKITSPKIENASTFYHDYFEEILDRLQIEDKHLYEKVCSIVETQYRVEDYENQKPVLLHHDYHLQNLMLETDTNRVVVIDWDSARAGIAEVDFIKAKYLCLLKISMEKKNSFLNGYRSVKELNLSVNYPIQELLWLCKMYLFEKACSESRNNLFYPSEQYYYLEIERACNNYREFSNQIDIFFK